jgi:hypothetical protein
MLSPIRSEPRTGKRRCVAGKFLVAMPTPARSIPMRTGKQSWSNGASMEPVTLGRAVAQPAPTPIREGRTQLRKCCGSFAITLPPHASPKRRIVRVLDELDRQVYDHSALARSVRQPRISDPAANLKNRAFAVTWNFMKFWLKFFSESLAMAALWLSCVT